MLRQLPFACALAVAATLPVPVRADVSLTAAGSTALMPVVKANADAYMSRHPEVKIAVTGGGSRVGVAAVAAGNADLGMSDTAIAGYPDLIDHHVCVVGFSVLANPGVGVTGLTRAQVRDIFAGRITNWKEVGGADLKVIAIARPRGSATQAVFAHVVMGGTPLAETGFTEDATGALVQDVRSTPGAISYAAFPGTKAYRDGTLAGPEGVVELALDGAAPTRENIGAGTYPLWSFEHIYTNGPPGKDASRFLAQIETNTEAVLERGFIPIRDMRAGTVER
jgi:phosphate transport system substrate-binding protein